MQKLLSLTILFLILTTPATSTELEKESLMLQFAKIEQFAKSGNASEALRCFDFFTEHSDELEDVKQRAIDCLEFAAENGINLAQYNLGVLYTHGHIVQKDLDIANKWLRHSEKGGDIDAAILLGLNLSEEFHENDESDRNILLESNRMLSKGVREGNLVAMRALGFNYLSATDKIEEAIELLNKAANQGDAGSMYYLASAYNVLHRETKKESYRELSKSWAIKANQAGVSEAAKFFE